MEGACGTQKRERKGMQDFGGENWMKECLETLGAGSRIILK